MIVDCLFVCLLSGFAFESVQEQEEKEYPKIIWMYWNPEPTYEVALFVQHTLKVLKGWSIVFLMEDTLDIYLNTSTFSPKYSALIPQHQSDYIRLLLLYNYGGVYLDATFYINSLELFEEINDEIVNKQGDLLAFATFHPFPKYLENGWLHAPKHSEIVKKWFDQYHYAVDTRREDYIQYWADQGLELVPQLACMVGTINTFLTCHVCLQVVIQRELQNTSKLLHRRTEDTFYKLASECNFEMDCITSKWKNEPKVREYPFFKSSGFVRKKMNFIDFLKETEQPHFHFTSSSWRYFGIIFLFSFLGFISQSHSHFI